MDNIELDYATSNITNSDDLREKIHEIHNYLRNNGIGYGLTSLKVFNLFYGLMKIEEYNLNEKIGLNDEKCKFSYLFKLAKENKLNIDILDKLIDIIYANDKINSLLAYNIPLDLKDDVYNHLIIEINSIKEIEKSSKEQLSGKIYEYFVGRDQSAISELGAYFTNRRIVDFIMNKTKPHIKVDGNIPKMIDMFGGSGGFTIGYIDYINKNFKIDWKSQLSNIYHIDINEDVLKSARLEFFCLSNGIFPNNENIIRYNSFKKEFNNEKFDLIVTNPPYGGDKIRTSAKKEKRDKIIKFIENEFAIFKKNIIEIDDIKSNKKILEILKKPKTKIHKILELIKDFDGIGDIQRIKKLDDQYNELKKENKIEIENNKKLCVNVDSCSVDIHRFAVKHKLTGTDKEACSLMLIMDLLEINGTAIGVLKEGLFFDSSYMELRKVLVKEYNIKEIISIPSNQFENTSTKTSIIIFTKEEQKTSQIKFSELKVNLYENDEFIEKDNKIYLKFNKGDIKNVEEIFIKSVSVDEILNNENISLNSKDYNKVSIQCGENFKLVKIGDICKFLPTTKHYTSIGKKEGKYRFYNSSQDSKLYLDTFEITEYSIILGQGGNFNIHIDKNFTASKHVCVIQLKIKNLYLLKYIYNIFPFIQKTLINNGSVIGWLNKTNISNIEVPIPETPELIEYWVNKVSMPYNLKQEKEKRFKEIEDEIQMKIKHIQENEKCEEVKLGNICKFNYGTRITKKDNENGIYPVYGGGDITFYTNKTNRKSNTLILSRYAMSKKCIRIINNPFYLNDSGLSIDTINFNQKYFNYLIINEYYQNYIYSNCTIGSIQKNINMNLLKELKIKLPMDKSLIDNLQPLFDEVENLQKEIKKLDETYNNCLQELSKSAIKNQEILNEPTINEITKEDDETKSNKSLTIDELKEQCKSLGIKGYSKKKKDELIEMIKNHK